jgi:hypothetical protein
MLSSPPEAVGAPRVKIIYVDTEPRAWFFRNCDQEDCEDRDFNFFLDSILLTYAQQHEVYNPNLMIQDWDPEEAERVYRNNIVGIYRKFSPFSLLLASSLDLVGAVRENAAQDFWFELSYGSRRDEKFSGPKTMSLSFGAKISGDTSGTTDSRVSVFVNYLGFLRDVLVDTLPPYYRYEYKIGNQGVLSAGLQARISPLEPLHVDLTTYIGFGWQERRRILSFVVPKGIADDDGWTTDTFITVNSSQDFGIDSITVIGEIADLNSALARHWTLDGGASLGFGYGLQLPWGFVAEPALQAGFFCASEHSYGQKLADPRDSVGIFYLSSAIGLDFYLAKLLRVNVSSQYSLLFGEDPLASKYVEFEMKFTSMDDMYQIALEYVLQGRGGSGFALRMGYRF